MLFNNTTLITSLLDQATWTLSSLNNNINLVGNPLLTMSTAHHHYAPHPWHQGEREMHSILHVPTRPNPTTHGLPPQYAYRVAESPIIAVGALDAQGRPWTTLWGGEKAFARGMGNSVLAMKNLVDLGFDPVVDALFGGSKNGEVVRPGEEGSGAEGGRVEKRLMAALSLDPETRDRVKIMGRLLAGAASPNHSSDKTVGEMQLAMLIEESLGNCPKYITIKQIRPAVPQPKLVSESLPLPARALEVISEADMVFLSSTDGETMDTNIRGGAPGFVRVASNATPENGGLVIVYPEYSGNRLYQTLGNFRVRPLVGMVIPNMATGDVLYVTGKVTVLVGERANAVLPHAKLAVRIEVEAVRFVEQGLPFRGEVVERSPYNPPVRALAVEKEKGAVLPEGGQVIGKAVLKGREMLSDSVARFTFKIAPSDKGKLKKWRAGQYVTLDFSEELDEGYSHMRDSDPQSINDDFIRTFTISSTPPATDVENGTEFQITARKHGPATSLLWRWQLRVPLEVPIIGFGGDESFHMLSSATRQDHESIFVAAGVGITPFLAQAPEMIAAGKQGRVAWSLRGEDLSVALDVFGQIEGMASMTTLFVTAGADDKLVAEARSAGAEVILGRMGSEDLLAVGGDKGKRRFYVCTGAEMLKRVMVWLEGEDTAVESFAY